ncbi:hypothetical protein CONLIGDRAFT_675134, partial [Coniochaeta ligniaria NRRL 30616]
MAEYFHIPRNHAEWDKQISRARVGKHDLPIGVTYKLSDLNKQELCSGSRITALQFLLLRTSIELVPSSNSDLVSELTSTGFCTEDTLKHAKGILISNKPFHRVATLSSHATLMGKAKPGAAKAAFPDDTDLLGKLVALRRAVFQLDLWRVNGGSLGTAAPAAAAESPSDEQDEEDPVVNACQDDDADDGAVQINTAPDQAPGANSNHENKPKSTTAKDELLVLFLAVELWNAMFTCASTKSPVLHAVPDQALFRVMRPGGENQVLYSAKVDGTIRPSLGRGPVVDIIEAKRRGGMDDRCKMQYAAELVAFVASKGRVEQNNHKFDGDGYARVFLHAQNCNRAYFVVARYTRSYVDWLHNSNEQVRVSRQRTREAFMEIRILGPRSMGEPNDV